MSSPQCEDGYTRIANELLEALCKIPLGNSEAQVFFCVLRKTYGWGKKQDDISISQIEEFTGVSRRMVIYAVQNLEARKILKVTRKRGRGIKNEINEIAIQKNYLLWIVQGKSAQYGKTLEKQRVVYAKSKGLVVQGIGSGARNGDLVVQGIEKKGQFLAPTKETKTKERKERTLSASPDAVQPGVEFIETKKKRKLTGKRLDSFKLFWEAFGYKKGKAEAADAWLDIPQMTGALVCKIVAASKVEALQRVDLLIRGSTPKMAQGWLSARRWEDEPLVPAQSAKTEISPVTADESARIRKARERFEHR